MSNMTSLESIMSPIKETMCWKMDSGKMMKTIVNQMDLEVPPYYCFQCYINA
jgi:hypothetical protein